MLMQLTLLLGLLHTTMRSCSRTVAAAQRDSKGGPDALMQHMSFGGVQCDPNFEKYPIAAVGFWFQWNPMGTSRMPCNTDDPADKPSPKAQGLQIAPTFLCQGKSAFELPF